MGKSLDEIYKKILEKQQQKREQESQLERERQELIERQRKHIIETRKYYESLSTRSSATSPSSASSGGGRNVAQKRLLGLVIDGPLLGATVTAVNEGISTITDSKGFFTFDFIPTGDIIVEGGVDIITGLEFTGKLKSVPGSTVISPVTTTIREIMDQGFTEEEATDVFFDMSTNVFGIELDESLKSEYKTKNFIESAVNGDDRMINLQVVATLLESTSEVTSKASSLYSGKEMKEHKEDFYKNIAREIKKYNGNLNLTEEERNVFRNNFLDTEKISNVVVSDAEKEALAGIVGGTFEIVSTQVFGQKGDYASTLNQTLNKIVKKELTEKIVENFKKGLNIDDIGKNFEFETKFSEDNISTVASGLLPIVDGKDNVLKPETFPTSIFYKFDERDIILKKSDQTFNGKPYYKDTFNDPNNSIYIYFYQIDGNWVIDNDLKLPFIGKGPTDVLGIYEAPGLGSITVNEYTGEGVVCSGKLDAFFSIDNGTWDISIQEGSPKYNITATVNPNDGSPSTYGSIEKSDGLSFRLISLSSDDSYTMQISVYDTETDCMYCETKIVLTIVNNEPAILDYVTFYGKGNSTCINNNPGEFPEGTIYFNLGPNGGFSIQLWKSVKITKYSINYTDSNKNNFFAGNNFTSFSNSILGVVTNSALLSPGSGDISINITADNIDYSYSITSYMLGMSVYLSDLGVGSGSGSGSGSGVGDYTKYLVVALTQGSMSIPYLYEMRGEMNGYPYWLGYNLFSDPKVSYTGYIYNDGKKWVGDSDLKSPIEVDPLIEDVTPIGTWKYSVMGTSFSATVTKYDPSMETGSVYLSVDGEVFQLPKIDEDKNGNSIYFVNDKSSGKDWYIYNSNKLWFIGNNDDPANHLAKGPTSSLPVGLYDTGSTYFSVFIPESQVGSGSGSGSGSASGSGSGSGEVMKANIISSSGFDITDAKEIGDKPGVYSIKAVFNVSIDQAPTELKLQGYFFISRNDDDSYKLTQDSALIDDRTVISLNVSINSVNDLLIVGSGTIDSITGTVEVI